MARRKMTHAPGAAPSGGVTAMVELEDQPTVRVEQFEAAQLATIAPESQVWREGLAGSDMYARGTFVRVQPPAEQPDGDVEELVRVLREAGCVVRVDPRRRPAVLVQQRQPGTVPGKNAARAAALALAGEANVQDRAALLALVESTLAEVGL